MEVDKVLGFSDSDDQGPFTNLGYNPTSRQYGEIVELRLHSMSPSRKETRQQDKSALISLSP
jgi:hypothetical protein